MTDLRGVDQVGSSNTRNDGLQVFISYAHDDVAHEERVRNFWWFLREKGIDARMDLPAAEHRQDWAEWMTREVRDADWILVVASPEYRRRAEGDAGPSEGRGVQWEARLIRDRFYADQKVGLLSIIPVVLPGCSADGIPLWMGPAATTHYLIKRYTVNGSEKLLRLLTGQHWEIQPPLGVMPILPPRPFGKIDRQPNPQTATLDSLFDIAANAYRSILRRRSEHYNHRVAAIHMVELGPSYLDEALVILREIWHDEVNSGEKFGILFSPVEYLLQSNEYKSEAISWLRRFLADEQYDYSDHFSAAKMLAAVGGDQRQEALAELYSLVAQEFSPGVAHHMLLLDYPSSFEVLRPMLLGSIEDVNSKMWDRLESAAILLACHEDHTSFVVPILQDVLKNHGTEVAYRIKASRILSWADVSLNRVVIESMLSIITSPISNSYDVSEAIDCLNNLWSVREADADLIIAALRPSLDVYHFDIQEVKISKLLYQLNAGFNSEEYVRRLRAVLESSSIWARRMAAVELISFDTQYAPEGTRALREIVASPQQDRLDRHHIQLLAAEDLLALGKQYAQPICHILKRPLVSQEMEGLNERERAASILIECTGPESTISILHQALTLAESKVPRNPYVIIELASTLVCCAKYAQSHVAK
jgi:hypothetical protein